MRITRIILGGVAALATTTAFADASLDGALNTVPEPDTLVLFGAAVIGLVAAHLRRRK